MVRRQNGRKPEACQNILGERWCWLKTVTVAADMERDGWILAILEVRPSGLPDGLDVESEEKGGAKDDCQIL